MKLNKKEIIVYVSSRNNYDMVEGAVLKNIPLDGYEFVNVDDGSCEAEITKGKEQANRLGFTFLQNKSRGVQWATQTVIDWVNENRPECKYIVCFQHDNYPLDLDFFNQMNRHVNAMEAEDVKIGLIGFNVLDKGNYTGDAYERWNNLEEVKGMIGLCHLGIMDNSKRWLCPKRQPELIKHPGFNRPFAIEFPMWAALGINVESWNKIILPTTDYQFHLWAPDIAFQFNLHNYMSVILPDIHCLNDQALKNDFGIDENSARGAMNGNEFHFGEYGPHLENFKKRWGWDYENVKDTYPQVRENYLGSLIEKYYIHDITTGPIWNARADFYTSLEHGLTL